MTHPSVASDTSPSLGEEPINENENENVRLEGGFYGFVFVV